MTVFPARIAFLPRVRPDAKILWLCGINIQNHCVFGRVGMDNVKTGGVSATLRDALAALTKGDAWTRLGLAVMGLGCLVRGQIVKGLLFLGAQISFIFFMIYFGAPYLSDITTLGTVQQGTVWDEGLQINRVVQGHNSILILLFSVLTLFVIGVFAVVWIKSAQAGWRAYERGLSRQKQPGFAQEARDFFNNKYHVVLLGWPSLGVFALTIMPLVFMILMSFTNYDRLHQPPGNLFTWVGFQNFRDIFWDDPLKSRTFFSLLSWNMVWAVLSTASCYLLGMLLALTINKRGIRLKTMWRTIFVITIAVPQFVSLMLMSRLLTDWGPINVLLQNWGWISEPIHFLTGDIARVTVLVVNLWVGVPYTMLITTGILMNIPADLYESARIDGAGPVVVFGKITLPYMLFVTTPYLITQFMSNINNFNVIYLLTGWAGVPNTLDYYQAGKTDLLVTWLYKQTVREQNYNLASAIGVIIFLILTVIGLATFNILAPQRKEETFQ